MKFLNLLSFEQYLVILSFLVMLIGSYAYIRDTLLGITQPNRVSHGMWALAPLIGTGAAISSGADLWVTSRIFFAGFIPLCIFCASFINPKSYWKTTKFDFYCGTFSLIALILWLLIDYPKLAILVAALADGFACLPTIIKAWKYPESETGITYVLGFISTLLVLPSIKVWNIENSAFQIYLMLACFIIVFAIYRKNISISK